MIKVGDKVEVDSIVATVTAVWASGKHTTYTLSDGRSVLDLPKLLGSRAKLLQAEIIAPRPKPFLKRRDDDEQ